ncbi:ubiquitin carboxyl-terminal hydrolase MINDY-2-like isoform X1 [Dermacentor albipictus]|uniref:ubiquitin carboxyl-terminal hydrolase MINDY-2-like isoform X1 n=1 Tax=Dermacentor albipictus TaxID=60249 RepID=UPI0031FBCD6F
MEQPSTQQQQQLAAVGGAGAGAEAAPVTENSDTASLAEAPAACRTETTTSCTSPSIEQPPQSVYQIKWVRWNNQKTPIVTQNENGPCPLIAIINVLTLKGLIKLPHTLDVVTVEQLMEHLGDCILSSIPKDIPESAQLNYEQNMHDAIAILPKLQTGLDVNVRFTGVKDFEYTPECIVFDLLRIPLYHGWLLDPECPEILAAVGNCSYNQLVERIIINKSSTKPELVTEALLAEAFLERTASQLTYHGLCELNSTVTEDELCVLFRNNHFITLHKRKDRLYQLVTDQGFLNEPDVVWESLINVEGDGQFADSDFVVNPPKPRCLTTEQQIDRDYLVALSLHHEQVHHERTKNDTLQSFVRPVEPLSHDAIRADEELAKQLQEEEHHRALSRPPARSASGSAQDAVESTVRQRQNNSSPPSKKDCTIL